MLDWVTSHWSTVLGALAGILAIVAAIVATYEQDQATAEQNKLLVKLDAKNEELARKNDRIVQLQEQSLANFTGGDSVIYFLFEPSPNGQLKANLTMRGEYPIRDAYLDCFNLSKSPGKAAREEGLTALPLMAPNANLIYNKFPFSDGDSNFVVWIHQPAVKIIQLVSIRKRENGQFVAAYRVFRTISKIEGLNEIAELTPPIRFVDSHFPLDANNKVPWIDYPELWDMANVKLNTLP